MRALVAMSGGVDSSVAAAIMAHKLTPKNVWGIYMQLHDEAPKTCNTKTKTCCGDADAADAQQVARILGIDFDHLQLHESFNKIVMQNFIDEITNGRTPIPCTHCNSGLKFDLLFKFADINDCSHIVTGHYANIINNRIYRANNQKKDQSYFLWGVKKENIHRLIFPLATFTKEEVRDYAEIHNLITARKPESMNLCFIPDGNTNRFIDKVVPENIGTMMLHGTNEILRENVNINHYTIGQRKNLGVNFNLPLYVRRKDIKSKIIWLSVKEEINSSIFRIHRENWHQDITTGHFQVMTRHNSQLINCIVDDNRNVLIDSPTVITPGQAAVFYQNNRLCGGGWIESI